MPRAKTSPTGERRCDWCGEALAGKRASAITCSQPCRQARARFRIGAAPMAPLRGRAIKVAYADPPYPGLARKYYKHEEVDHARLVADLVLDFPDGWALSTSAEACRAVWELCPVGTRLCPWFRGARRCRSFRARNGWEALLVYGGRGQRLLPGDELTDCLVFGGRQHSHPGALPGMKPAAFAEWMFRLLGLRDGDELVDLFPGSGAIRRAWQRYTGARIKYAHGSRLQEAQAVATAATTAKRTRQVKIAESIDRLLDTLPLFPGEDGSP